MDFPSGRTLLEELRKAMQRVERYGVVYPPGYYDQLVLKYERETIFYPHILMIIGEPRINTHFCYRRYSQMQADFLTTAAEPEIMSAS